ncbi:GNAT family N-acetyltransferase [Ornithinimicrobium cryptoxanthini]|uniref:GNAT family N-acetyltransferase n=1 Tax=Ornithinimicrobium cryptoxanthini TaxID=2934161 RepID=UPI0021182912|nr:GNAT family N-acetyltransferase [Ornithinimicrobium cryptoxanthini]
MDRHRETEGMTLRFRRAAREDTAAAQAAYQQIIEHLGATVDYPHWHSENHPSPAEVEQWVEAGDLYLALAPVDADDEQIAGAMVLDHNAPAAYQDAVWAIEAASEQVLVVHALGVHPGFLRQGMARFLVHASLEVARQKGCRAVRLDTYVENLPARRLYASQGFDDLGIHTLHYDGTDLTQFHLFERVL